MRPRLYVAAATIQVGDGSRPDSPGDVIEEAEVNRAVLVGAPEDAVVVTALVVVLDDRPARVAVARRGDGGGGARAWQCPSERHRRRRTRSR